MNAWRNSVDANRRKLNGEASGQRLQRTVGGADDPPTTTTFFCLSDIAFPLIAVWNYGAVIPADLMTADHRRVSSALRFSASWGEPPNGVTPRSLQRCARSGRTSTALIALFSLATTSADTPEATEIVYHGTAASPGTPTSAIAGVSGSSAIASGW